MNTTSRTRQRTWIALLTASATLGVATPGRAAISNTSPSADDTVTVDTTSPNPATGTINNQSGAGNVTVNVDEGAGITGNADYDAIEFDGSTSGTVTNDGTITGGDGDYGDGIFFDDSANGSVTNNGIITGGDGDYGDGIFFDDSANGSVTNNGIITGGDGDYGDGISFGYDHPGELDNSGTISGFIGVFLGGGGSITNQTGGTISGSNDAVRVFGPTQITNAGTIDGQGGTAIQFGFSDDDRLTLEPGSDIIGTVDASGGTDTLALGGDTGSDSFDVGDIGSSAQYKNFDTFTKEGESTWTLTGSGDQDWTVNGGTLKGDATLGGLTANGGTVAPGNSIGTLTVTGDVSLAADSTYDAEINGDGTSDLIDATGQATLANGSTVNVIVENNGDLIKGGDRWTILNADGGVTDDGTTISSDFAGFSFAGSVSGTNDEFFRLTAVADAIAPSQTQPTAHRVALALDADAASGNASSPLDAFITQTRNRSVDQAREVLQASTPRPVATTQLTEQRVTRRFHSVLSSRIRYKRQNTSALANQTQALAKPVGGQLASAAANDPRTLGLFFAQTDNDNNNTGPSANRLASPSGSASDADDSRFGGFAVAYGIYDDHDAEDGNLGSQANTAAGQFGIDYQISDDWLAGVSFSYARSNIDFDDQNGGNRGGNEVDTIRVGPYVGYDHGPWFADASLTYAWNRNNLERRIPATGDSFEADYDSHELAAYLGGGYDLELGDDWRLTPQASVQYVKTWAQAYQESGGGGALAVDDAEFDSLRSTLGLSVAKRFEVSRVQLMPHAQVGWGHEYLDDDQGVSARFVGGSNPFTISSAANDDDSLYYGAGLTALLSEHASFDLSYTGETFEDGQTHALRAAVRVNF